MIPSAGTPGPLRFEVEADIWAQVFGDPNSADEVEFEYWYELERPTIAVNPVSPSAFGVVDFAYAGPEQPNLPDRKPQHSTGGGSGARAHRCQRPTPWAQRKPAMRSIMNWPVWADGDQPVTGREIVTFYYQGKQVGAPFL
ncbi:hypothetical protein [Pseudomonas sp. S2_F03]